ncbi:MAG: hypothetical protein QNJ00_02520 [Woeseiaceae bacterium]|nr:hypothetical protein [Woeseiaceae bacterium]
MDDTATNTDAAIEDLMAMIRTMVEDDDLSIVEFAQLDRWLADHPQVAEHWPANLIGEGVRAICADNVVDQQELDALCGALKRIANDEAE